MGELQEVYNEPQKQKVRIPDSRLMLYGNNAIKNCKVDDEVIIKVKGKLVAANKGEDKILCQELKLDKVLECQKMKGKEKDEDENIESEEDMGE